MNGRYRLWRYAKFTFIISPPIKEPQTEIVLPHSSVNHCQTERYAVIKESCLQIQDWAGTVTVRAYPTPSTRSYIGVRGGNT